ncbi:SapC family protein [Ancylobacter polymorphus]|uniref:SapC family protein n=1 Tax=Ancylobacter polymorphus TaxID=223390 RepID=A0ABU0B8W6_9HYPH|nr:SapC family protein [Ancylobacter polymorphus]MDQ0302248.1 hypothetical protein [Ancylobacter polymorphus]
MTKPPAKAPKARKPKGAAAAPLPLFYRKPTLLRFESHGRLSLRRAADFRFAARATSLPLVAAEFAAAGRDYPLVFASDEGAMPLAVTGITAEQNLFVEADGRWRAGSYIPGYVRRYPFIGITAEDSGSTMLGVDLASDRLADEGEKEADMLFDLRGAATRTSQSAMALCEAYATEHTRTRAFVQALKDKNLLVPRSAQVSFADAGRAVVQGFQLVDEAAFRALPAAAVVEFHAKGWLDLIVLHLASQQRWRELVDMSARVRAEAAH